MTRTMLALLFAAATLTTATACGDTMRALRIANYETRGVSSATRHVLEQSLHDVGVVPIPVDMPLARGLIEVDKGEILDADPARALEAVRDFRHVVVVPEPVYRLRLGAFIRRGSAPVKSRADLRSRQVIAYSGSVVLERLLAANHVAHVTRAETYITAVLMLASGRGDVAILPREEVIAALDELPVRFIEPSGPLLSDVPLYLVLNKRYADLVAPLAEAIRQNRGRQEMASAR